MALQDLTPQLRTRLNRMERAVGWFMFIATALLLVGFGYYIYNAAERKGWFKTKVQYYTYANTAKGINVGDPVMLLGFTAGHITEIQPMPPRGEHEIFVGFEILQPNYGYLWTKGTRARLTAADLLGKRVMEVTKGSEGGYGTYVDIPVESVRLEDAPNLPHQDKLRLGQELYSGTNYNSSNLISRAWAPLTPDLIKKAGELGLTNIWVMDTSQKKEGAAFSMWNMYDHHYQKFVKGNKMHYELPQDEEPALTDRAQALLTQVEKALPNILDITNRINAVLSNTANLTSNFNVVAVDARPTVSNLATITANIKDPKGSLGEWIIPTNINQKLEATLDTTHKTIGDADTNLVAVAESITLSLNNLANITSNLNNQVQANSNIISHLSDIVVHTDEFVQGLKRHWLLRSAFKTKPVKPAKSTNAPATINAPSDQGGAPLRSPKAAGQQ